MIKPFPLGYAPGAHRPIPHPNDLSRLVGLDDNEIKFLRDMKRDELVRQTISDFETQTSALSPKPEVTMLSKGELDKSGEALSRDIIEVGPLQLVHSQMPLGNSLPEGERAVSSPNDLVNGNPFTAVDHFLQKKVNGLMTTAFTKPSIINGPDDPQRAEKEARNAEIASAGRQFNAWQLMYVDTTDPHRPTIEFEPVLPPAGAEFDHTVAPSAEDMQLAFDRVQGEATALGREVDFNYPLDRFTA